MLRREDNTGYYEILREFGKLSGLEAVLNTSFNLHGEPIVESPENALESFSKSQIDILLFDHLAISR
jgi:carbamoyltransferase